jgi:hypothetical protein
MKRLKKFIREQICANWEKTIGPVGILVCDLSLSINLLRKPSQIEKYEGRETGIPTYGITIEPFAINLMGSDGDVCWSSPGWYLVNWVFSADTTTATPSSSVSGEPLFGFNLGV